MGIVGNANPTRLRDPFETHCNIDTITKDIIVCDDNITEVNADTKFDPLALRHIGILFCHAALTSSAQRTASTTLANSTKRIPGVLDDTS